jgi:hypothetical protein
MLRAITLCLRCGAPAAELLTRVEERAAPLKPEYSIQADPCRCGHLAYNERMENETEIEKLARIVKSGFDRMDSGFDDVHQKFAEVRADMTTGFDAVNKHMAVLDQKIDHVDAKLDTHRQETKDGFAVMHRAIGGLTTTLADHEERIKVLEGE